MNQEVKRYRKRELVNLIVERHADLYPPPILDELRQWLGRQDNRQLAFLFTDQTGREVVYNKGGLFYGIN